MVFVWQKLHNYCLALYCFTASCLLLIALVLDGIPEGDFLGEESEEWTPTLRLFLKRGDDGEWARVTKMQCKLPFRHFREGGNPEILSAKNGPPCSRSVMSITGWYICDMRILF